MSAKKSESTAESLTSADVAVATVPARPASRRRAKGAVASVPSEPTTKGAATTRPVAAVEGDAIADSEQATAKTPAKRTAAKKTKAKPRKAG